MLVQHMCYEFDQLSNFKLEQVLWYITADIENNKNTNKKAY